VGAVLLVSSGAETMRSPERGKLWGNSTRSSLGPARPPRRLSKAPGRRPKIVGGVSGPLGSPPSQRRGGVLGEVPPAAVAPEPRGLLEQIRTVLVPVYGSGCPEFLATMRETQLPRPAYLERPRGAGGWSTQQGARGGHSGRATGGRRGRRIQRDSSLGLGVRFSGRR